MIDNPFHDLNWWAAFIRSDPVIQNQLLVRAMCSEQGLSRIEFEAFNEHFMDKGAFRHPSGYDGPFDRRYLYPLSVGFEVRVNQFPGRLELHAVDRLLFFEDKTMLIARADPHTDWFKVYQEVLDDIDQNYPHLSAWHEALRRDQFLEHLQEPDDSE